MNWMVASMYTQPAILDSDEPCRHIWELIEETGEFYYEYRCLECGALRIVDEHGEVISGG